MKFTVQIDLDHEIAKLPDQERKDFLERMATHDSVIEHVASQIIYGCTENGSHGSEIGNEIDLWTYQYPTPLMSARRFLRDLAPEAIQKELKDIADAATRERERHSEASTEWHRRERVLNEQIEALRREVFEVRNRLEWTEQELRDVKASQ